MYPKSDKTNKHVTDVSHYEFFRFANMHYIEVTVVGKVNKLQAKIHYIKGMTSLQKSLGLRDT